MTDHVAGPTRHEHAARLGYGGPLSRRGFLAATAAAAAYAAAGGTASAQDKEGWAPIKYDEAVKAVKDFEEFEKITYARNGIHTVKLQYYPDGRNYDIEVRWDGEQPPIFKRPFEYKFEYEPKPRVVPIRPRKVPVMTTHGFPVKVGHTAKGVNLGPGAGTVGWIIYLNDKLVCVSAHHVLCVTGNASGTDQRCILNGETCANLDYFERIDWSGENLFDLATAKFDKHTNTARLFKPCEDGTTPFEYPMTLSAAPESGAAVHKVGAGSTTCTKGTHDGVGTCYVLFPNERMALFTGQLFFTRMARPGDSGAAVTLSDTHEVCGLHFTGTDSDSVSNPLFRIPWKLGDPPKKDLNGKDIPNYYRVGLPGPG